MNTIKKVAIGLTLALGIGLAGGLAYTGATGLLINQPQIEQGDADIQTPDTEKDELLKQIDNLKAQIEEYKTQQSQNESKISSLQSEIEAKEQELAEKTKECEEKKTELESAAAQLNEAQSQLTEANQELQAAQGQVETLTEQASSLNSRIEELQTEGTKNQEQIKSLQTEKANVEAQLETEKSNVQRLNTQVQDLEGKIQTLTSEKSQLENDKSRLESTVSSLQSEKGTLEGKVSQLQSEKEKFDEQLKLLQEKIAELQLSLLGGVEIDVSSINITENSFQNLKFKAVDGGVLLTSTQENFGVWFYDNQTQKFKHAFETGTEWTNFQETNDGCLITSKKNTHLGILFYNNATHEVTQVHDIGSRYTYFHKINGGWLIGSSSSNFNQLLYFDDTTHEITDLGLRIGQCKDPSFIDLENGILISYRSGKAYLKNGAKSVQEIEGLQGSFCKINGGALNSRSDGLYFVDEENFQSTLLHTTGGSNYWDIFKQVDGGWLVSSTTPSDFGLLFVDDITHEVSVIRQGGYKYNKFTKIQDGYLIVGDAQTGYDPALIYNESTHEISKELTAEISEGPISFMYCGSMNIHPVSEGFFVTQASEYNSAIEKGIWFYDYSTQELTQIVTDGYNWDLIQKIDNGYLLATTDYDYDSTTNGKGVVFFDISTKTTKRLMQGYGLGYWHFVANDDICVVFSDHWGYGNRALYRFDSESQELVEFFSYIVPTNEQTPSISPEDFTITENEIQFKCSNKIYSINKNYEVTLKSIIV